VAEPFSVFETPGLREDVRGLAKATRNGGGILALAIELEALLSSLERLVEPTECPPCQRERDSLRLQV
jgi:hypothetical protein